MTMLKNWIFSVIAVSALLSVAESIVPKGKFRTILRCGGGLVFLFAMLQPILQADWTGYSRAFTDWKWELDGMSEKYEENQRTELEKIIAEKTAAYIEEKAAAMGVVCDAEVICVDRDGVPFPSEIVMNIPYFDALSKQIDIDLDIKLDKQHWQEVTE